MTQNPIISPEDLRIAGWTEILDDGFIGHVGPVWQLIREAEASCGVFVDDKHKNRSSVAHGGMLATLADRALGFTARLSDPSRSQATISLNMHYIDVARPGEFVAATGTMLKQTRALAFLSGHLEANGRLIANVTGIWRIAPR